MRSEKVLERIFTRSVLTPLKNNKVPCFDIPVRSAANVKFNEKKGILELQKQKMKRRLNNIGEIRAFMQTCLIANIIHKSLIEQIPMSIRDIYYDALHSSQTLPKRIAPINDQNESNKIIEDLEVISGLSREDMGILCDIKGKIVGDLKIRSKKDTIDCSKMGEGAYAIPTFVDRLKIKDVNVDFVLVVEKDAIFGKLNMTEYWKKNKCALLTAKGQPDRASRRFIKRLSDEFELPIYILTDSDPYGFQIYNTYRMGSISLSFISDKLACPEAKFLGVSCSDIYKYKLQDDAIPATEKDLKKARELKDYPWFKQSKKWQHELALFLKRKEKVEIEVFSRLGLKFLAEKYLPEKIRELE